MLQTAITMEIGPALALGKVERLALPLVACQELEGLVSGEPVGVEGLLLHLPRMALASWVCSALLLPVRMSLW